MARRRSLPTGPLNRPHPPPSALKKKTLQRGSSTPSKPWSAKRSQGAASAVQDKIQTLMLSSLVCLGRHTITGLLHAAGGSFQDWSALYRVFSQSRLDSEALFAAVRRGVVAQLRPGEPLVVAQMIRCCPRGTKTPGVAGDAIRWVVSDQPHPRPAGRRDRSRATRRRETRPGAADPHRFPTRATPPKPRQNAPCEERRSIGRRRASLARRGAARLHALRQNLDQEHDAADGSRCWSTVVSPTAWGRICRPERS